jgi:hypothetical protein
MQFSSLVDVRLMESCELVLVGAAIQVVVVYSVLKCCTAYRMSSATVAIQNKAKNGNLAWIDLKSKMASQGNIGQIE